jgi:DNA topoisomerase-1
MSKTLVIVESPSKIKKLQTILGSSYIIVASVGHIYGLPKKHIGIDIDNNFEPKYVPEPDKKQVIIDIGKAIKKCSMIYLAQDKDREGEGIAQGIIDLYGLKEKDYKRIVFTSITKKPILEAIKSPIELNKDLVDAQKTRRLLDRIVGYKLSPILWKNIQHEKSLSAGRVQSPIIKLIIDRENEIKTFFNNENNGSSFYSVKAAFPHLNCSFYRIKNTNKMFKGTISHIDNKKDMIKILNKFNKSTFEIKYKFDKQSEKNPPPPFMTSSLQQEAFNKFGMSSVISMQVAQKLYSNGYITYLRTDSVEISEEGQANIKKYIIDNYSKKYYSERAFKSKVKNAQEAHEAIRPTNIDIKTLDDTHSDYEIKLYYLIWKRTVASQMAASQINTTTIQVSISKLLEYYFQTSIEEIIFDGFMIIYKEVNNNNDNKLNKYKINDKLELIRAISTLEYKKPGSRYNYATINNKMKDLGIGRPATWAMMIDKLLNKEYIKCTNIDGITKNGNILTLENNEITDEDTTILLGKESNKFIPTDIGYKIIDFLNTNFNIIMDYAFTAHMEQQCDDVSNGKLKWYDVLREFYDTIEPNINKFNINLFTNKDGILIGIHPDTNEEIVQLSSKKNNYIRMGDRTASIDQTISLDEAIELLKYPYKICEYQNKDVIIKFNKNLYFAWNDKTFSISKDKLNEKSIIETIEEKQNNIIKELKKGKKKYTIMNGEYGPFVQIKTTNSKTKAINISIPKKYDPQNLTIEIISEMEKYKKKKLKK